MDLKIIEALQGLRTDFFDKVIGVLTDFGSLTGFIFVFALLFWLYDKRYSVNFAISYGVVAIFNSLVLKNIFRRPRPLLSSTKYPPYSGYPKSFSFPSGHSASIGAMAGYNIYESYKNKRAFATILPISIVACLLIGFSRMYLGVHYLTDIIVGLWVGYVVSFLFFKFVRLKSDKIIDWALLAVPAYIILLIVLDNHNIYGIGSFFISVVIGLNIEKRWIKYEPKKVKNIPIKLAIGLPLLIGYYLFMLFVRGSKYIIAIQYIGYGLLITCLVPLILSRLKGKDKMISKSEKDTLALGKKIASKVRGGEVLLLNGDLGSGKTVFAKGFALGLKIKEPITSPTFTIVNKYEGKLPMYHFDMYRLEDEEEAMAAGLDELIDEAGAVKLIEWSEKVTGLLPEDCIVVDINKIDDTTREINVKGINV